MGQPEHHLPLRFCSVELDLLTYDTGGWFGHQEAWDKGNGKVADTCFLHLYLLSTKCDHRTA